MERGFGTGACAAKPETPSPPEREKGGSRGRCPGRSGLAQTPSGQGRDGAMPCSGGGLPVPLVPCHSCPGPTPACRTETSLPGGMSCPCFAPSPRADGWTQKMPSWMQRDTATWMQSWCCGMRGTGDDARPSKGLTVINKSH